MNASLPRLGLVAAATVSSLLGQEPGPAAAIPDEVRRLLDAPVWYFNYTVILQQEGAPGGAGRARRERITTGRMMMGVRSSGPSLSVMVNPSLMVITQPDQIDRLVAGYANWLHGPPPEDESLPPERRRTQEQEDAYILQVRQANVKAFHRVRYDYAAPGERTSASGSGTVTHIHEPALEFDAASRRYRLMFAPFDFTDSDTTLESYRGARETGIGTIHYVRQEIKSGLLYGDDDVGALDPPLRYFEGPLPGTFGNIVHSSTHRVKGTNMSGTLTVQFTLSPLPPVPVEFIIEPPANYVEWQPLGDKDEKTAGDGIPIKVTLQKIGGGPPPIKAMKYTYLLWKTSRELGVCLNWPPNPDAALPFDLQFEQEENRHLLVEGTDRQIAVHTVPADFTDTVMVSCFDYGAHGEFAATAELENGQIVHGKVKFTANQQELKLPFRADGSLIAAEFMNRHGLSGVTDDDDGERDPVGDGFTGDGLTLYEEYRGFMVGDNWTSANPKKKDLFVVNEMRGDRSLAMGLRLFQRVTNLEVHDLLRENQVRDVGLINFNRTAGPHLVDQSAIRIQRGTQYALGNRIAEVTGDVGTPGTAKTVSIPPDLDIFLGRPYMASTFAHELLHACNVYHHGEKDREVMWSYEPGGTQFYESSALYDAQGNAISGNDAVPITVKDESGTVIAPRQFFRAGLYRGVFNLGEAHGQHSGDDTCIMRYDVAFTYKSQRDPSVRYLSGREQLGLGLCTTAAGTGVNDAGRRMPEPRYHAAATPQNGGRGVAAKRGDCVHQIRVNDLATEPKR